MGWGILTTVVAIALFACLAALTTIFIWNGIRGSRRSPGLLRDPKSREIVPERIQALVFAAAFVLIYAGVGLVSLASPQGPQMPEPPDWLVSMLAASQTLYLSGKIARRNSR